jgi:hypothetical protein
MLGLFILGVAEERMMGLEPTTPAWQAGAGREEALTQGETFLQGDVLYQVVEVLPRPR